MAELAACLPAADGDVRRITLTPTRAAAPLHVRFRRPRTGRRIVVLTACFFFIPLMIGIVPEKQFAPPLHVRQV